MRDPLRNRDATLAPRPSATERQGLPRRPAMTNLIGLIGAQPAGCLLPVCGRSPEQVVARFGLRATRVDFQAADGSRIVRDGSDAFGDAFGKLLEARLSVR
ncbi:hypothetical protein WS86_22825 [Burkholderia savannae]|nr:hypothetical protein WS86_22825 [Burkholderia savannae]